MITAGDEERALDILRAKATKDAPMYACTLSREMGVNLQQANTILHVLQKRWLIECRMMCYGQLGYYIPALKPAPQPEPGTAAKAEPDAVPEPSEYVDADEDLHGEPRAQAAPEPMRTLDDIEKELEGQVIPLWEGNSTPAQMAKAMHVRVDRVQNIIRRLLKEGRIQPRERIQPRDVVHEARGEFPARCGKVLPTQQGQHSHESRCKKCKALAHPEEPKAVQAAGSEPLQVRVGTSSGGGGWAGTFSTMGQGIVASPSGKPPAAAPVGTDGDGLAALKDLLIELRKTGCQVNVAVSIVLEV